MGLFNHHDVNNIIDTIDHEVRQYEKNTKKFNELKEGDPEVRENYKGFGLNAVISSVILITLSLGGILTDILLPALGSIKPVGAIFLGLFCAMVGIAFSISTYKIAFHVKWQRRLNKHKIGVAALVLMVLHILFAIGLAVSGIFMMVGGFHACGA